MFVRIRHNNYKHPRNPSVKTFWSTEDRARSLVGSDLAVSLFLFLIGCVVIFAAGKLVWAWL